MNDLPPMPAAAPEPKSKAKPKDPDLVFVMNARTSLYTLRWHDAQHPAPGAAASKFLGPGLNLVAQSIVDACTPKVAGAEFGEHTGGALSLCEPLKLRTGDAVDLASRTSSRQALHAWRKIEKRPDVLAAIAERLEPKAKAPTVSDIEIDAD
jgi:hypothetical protein